MASRIDAFGARRADWRHFAALGLTADLLPVVSDPNAGISPLSRMQSTGKTPSVFGGDGLVVGLSGWTRRETTEANIARWEADGRLGICIQTRHVRAIDVDVEDPAQAQEIAAEVEAFLLARYPVRSRENTGKFLIAFRLEGEHRKRIIRTATGIIEFLATGQQFVAIGTHPSGARYQWDGGDFGTTPDGLPAEIPEMRESDFFELWLHLNERFGVEPETVLRAGRAPSGAEDRDPSADDVVRFLEENDWITGVGREGERYVRCPWEHEHTSDSGITATAWFPAGTGGYAQGHFKCLHAHCNGRGREEFLAECGYAIEDFEVLPTVAVGADGRVLPAQGTAVAPQAGAGGAQGGAKGSGLPAESEEAPWPKFERVAKGAKAGKILATANNVMKALRRADFCGWHIAYDEFKDEVVAAEFDGRALEHVTGWEPFRDDHYMRIRMVIEDRGFESISKELLRDAIALAARECTFDSAKAWLLTRTWDRVPRIETFFSRYLGTTDTPYSRALGLYLWSALAGRVLDPGCKADIVPILEGKQGIRKSTAVAAMAPAPEYFVEVGLADKEEDLARKMRGALVAEIAELDGLHTRAIEGIKKFITRTHEKWVPKYKEFATTFARRLVFVGTTNKDDLLADETGNRRWAPINVRWADVEAILRDRDQLWAEGAEVFALAGVCWQGVEDHVAPAHAAYAMGDEWEGPVRGWLDAADPFADGDQRPRGDKVFTTAQLLMGAIGLPLERIDRKAQNRVSPILRALGYERKVVRRGHTTVRAWVKSGNAGRDWLGGEGQGQGADGAGAGLF